MAAIAVLYVPCPSRAVALTLTRQLLAARLIGCANVIGSDSRYVWKGARVSQREFILLAKTTPAKAAAARRWIARHHPYQVPLVGRLSLEANAAYARWLGHAVGAVGRVSRAAAGSA